MSLFSHEAEWNAAALFRLAEAKVRRAFDRHRIPASRQVEILEKGAATLLRHPCGPGQAERRLDHWLKSEIAALDPSASGVGDPGPRKKAGATKRTPPTRKAGKA